MSIYRGTYWSQTFTLTDADGVAIDITGYEFEADLRDAVADADSLLNLTTANGGFAVTTAASGIFIMTVTAAQSLLLPLKRLVFDVHRTDADPGPRWLFRAKVLVRESATRD